MPYADFAALTLLATQPGKYRLFAPRPARYCSRVAQKLDTQAIGLDAGLKFIHWLTGAENLHYGYWDGLQITAANLRAAQDAYTANLFKYISKKPLNILDIGGGAGTTAAKLIALGHRVHIVVPSPLLAQRCRTNAPKAQVDECRFEDFQSTAQFDLCLFSESFQYIKLDTGLRKARSLLTASGEILIADCFRSEAFQVRQGGTPGGGHRIGAFRKELAKQPLTTLSEDDITAAVAPSIDLEQGLFNVIGHAIGRIDQELQSKRPVSRWLLARGLGVFLNKRKRLRLDRRLNEQTRNSAAFVKNNHYLILRLKRS